MCHYGPTICGSKLTKHGWSRGHCDTPTHHTVHTGDGNCLFRTLSFIITGSEEQHTLVHEAILHHMLQIAHFMLSHHIIGHSSVSEYIEYTCMDQDGTWGTDIEIFTLAHLLNTCIFVYTTEQFNWWRYGPQNVDRSLNVDITSMTTYIQNPGQHFNEYIMFEICTQQHGNCLLCAVCHITRNITVEYMLQITNLITGLFCITDVQEYIYIPQERINQELGIQRSK